MPIFIRRIIFVLIILGLGYWIYRGISERIHNFSKDTLQNTWEVTEIKSASLDEILDKEIIIEKKIIITNPEIKQPTESFVEKEKIVEENIVEEKIEVPVKSAKKKTTTSSSDILWELFK